MIGWESNKGSTCGLELGSRRVLSQNKACRLPVSAWKTGWRGPKSPRVCCGLAGFKSQLHHLLPVVLGNLLLCPVPQFFPGYQTEPASLDCSEGAPKLAHRHTQRLAPVTACFLYPMSRGCRVHGRSKHFLLLQGKCPLPPMPVVGCPLTWGARK
jgi:hypothetical protein